MPFRSPNQQRQSTEGILTIDYHCLNKYNFRFHRIVVSAEAAGRLNPQPSSKNGGSDVLRCLNFQYRLYAFDCACSAVAVYLRTALFVLLLIYFTYFLPSVL